MKRLYATTDLAEAQILRALLRDAGIESSLDNEAGAAFAIGLPTSAAPLGINVSDEDAAAAAEVLAAHFEKQTVMEDDPEAPPPLTPEESAAFDEKVRRGRPRRRWWMALLLLLFPGAAGTILASWGARDALLITLAAAGACLATVWFVNLLGEKEDGSAPR